jgi:hypothetical protein
MAEEQNIMKDGVYSIGVLGGEERVLKFDLNAFAELERIYGDMDKANEALNKGSIKDIRTILWVGLIWNHAVLDEITGEPVKYDLTMHAVGSWLTLDNMKTVMDSLMNAIGGSVPETPEDKVAQVGLKAPLNIVKEETEEVTADGETIVDAEIVEIKKYAPIDPATGKSLDELNAAEDAVNPN